MNKDTEHLKILSIMFYILAGICVLPILAGIMYMVMGVFFGAAMMSAEASRHGDGPPPALFGGIFVGVGLVIVLIFSTLSFLIFKVGRNLSRYQSYTFCMVIAGIICLWIPLGTILGIFTLIVLSRDSVKAIFNGGNPNLQQAGYNPQNWQQ